MTMIQVGDYLYKRVEAQEEPEYPSRAELAAAAVIQDSRDGYAVSLEGHYIDSFREWDDALAALEEEMEAVQYWPDLYYVNERGNVSMLDAQGNELMSWV
jgi:hypothetical protein